MRSARPAWRRVAGPALATLVMLAVLVGLGLWQLARLDGKQRLLAEIDTAEREPPVPLPATPAGFQKIEVSGTWRPQTARYGADVRDTAAGPRMGSQLIGVLDRPSPAPPVLVDLGWVADGVAATLPQVSATVVGYARPPDRPGWLSASDDPPRRRFFTLDPQAIGRALGVEPAPYTVVALRQPGDDARPGPASTPAANPAPIPGSTPTPGPASSPRSDPGSGVGPGLHPIAADVLPRPANNHFTYALTWFGLAGALLVVFGLWLRQDLSGPARRGDA